MKKLYFILSILALQFMFVGQITAQAQKTLVRSIALEGRSELLASLPGQVELQVWDKDFARLQTVVAVENCQQVILDRLVAVGRYEIALEDVGTGYKIIMPKGQKVVKLKGEALEEEMKFILYVPQKVATEIENLAMNNSDL
ncbi:hypothetical protein PPO43_00450 [Saprospira sp. CCB-QB6]|uniref:hypothetical protein n=1 Tax=Saprospira sp. CCB-QB6 TaxID=3023936 RepID=UPI00234ACE1C|nr:hypothetical protein [Saprospira sp. CCB-QB6]WCL81566.1 hypothetical protein PPO43_00450 [Saprospira sp. CCB-QB6]